MAQTEVKTSSAGGISFQFEPNAERVGQLDQRLRDDLRESLAYVLGELAAHIPLDQSAIKAFLRRLFDQPALPQTFLIYGDLILAVDHDDLKEASRLVTQLLSQPAATGQLEMTELADPGVDAEAARLVRFINSDLSIHFEIGPPEPVAAQGARRKILEAFRLLDKVDAPLAEEARALIREVIFSSGPADPSKPNYNAASTLLLWGAILVNVDRLGGELDIVQMLVHESAHNLLFGLSPADPLVMNDPSARYTSPLRADPRPMEGIYHAAFVTARMYRAVKHLAESGLLTSIQQQQAEEQMSLRTRIFASAMTTIREHGQLTSLGKTILEGAAASMPIPDPA